MPTIPSNRLIPTPPAGDQVRLPSEGFSSPRLPVGERCLNEWLDVLVVETSAIEKNDIGAWIGFRLQYEKLIGLFLSQFLKNAL